MVNGVVSALIYRAIAVPAGSPVPGRFLDEDERIALADGLVAGNSLRTIATRAWAHPVHDPSGIRRNSDRDTGIYQPRRTERRGGVRHRRPKKRKLAGSTSLWAHVDHSLHKL